MIMLLGAFSIGYGIAWLIRRVTINDLRESGTKYQQEIRNLHVSLENLELAKDKLQEELKQCTESRGNMVNLEELQRATSELRKERERSETARNSLIEIESAHEALKQELQLKINQMLNPEEANKLRAELNRLRLSNATLEEEIKELRQQVPQEIIKSTKEAESALDPEHSEMAAFVSSIGIKAASSHEKDDLKKISGVGPFIEQKLHRLGIYTYGQIASMTHEQAERINEAIEFFPGRIQRDDWVSQAKRLGEQ